MAKESNLVISMMDKIMELRDKHNETKRYTTTKRKERTIHKRSRNVKASKNKNTKSKRV